MLDFDLRKAMTYNPRPDRYILKPRGVSMADQALTVTGSVDSALFNTEGDHAETYDGIVIPLPSFQEALIALPAGAHGTVDFPSPVFPYTE